MAEAGSVAIRAVLSPAGHAREDEPWVHGGQRIPAEPPALEGAGDEVLDEHIGVAHEPLQERLTAGVRQVERDRALAARVNFPPQLAALTQPRAQRIAATWIFDLDHVGAVIGQHGREHAAGDEARAVDHTQARQRAAHGRSL